MVMKLNVYGIEALTKFIDAMTTQQADQFIVVRTDSYQAHQPSNKRGFIVELYDDENHYIEAWDLNDKTYTLDEAREILKINNDSNKNEDLGTEQKHLDNFFDLNNNSILDEYRTAYDKLAEHESTEVDKALQVKKKK